MNYEILIGLRLLYRGDADRNLAVAFVVSALCALGGGALFLATDGGSGIGVLILTGGMLASVLFGLLYFLSVFTTVSVLGVVLGVAALTIVLSVTTGFQKEFREKVLGVNAHVIVQKNSANFSEYRDVEAVAQNIDPEVIAVQPFIFVEMLVTRGRGELSGVAIKGIDPRRVNSVLDLHKHMVEGEVSSLEKPSDGDEDGAEDGDEDGADGADGDDDGADGDDVDDDGSERDAGARDDKPVVPEPGAEDHGAATQATVPPIILGQVLAKKLKAEVGDEVTVVAPLSSLDLNTWTSTGDAPRSKKFRISGIFYSGFDEYDRRLMYIHLKDAQDLLGQGDRVQGIELKVVDVGRADEIARSLDAALNNPQYHVQDWRELNKNLFTALTLQKWVLLIILTVIIFVAAFNMVSALTMMVTDKTREIAILKSMGATSDGIARVFQVVGFCIGGIGTVIGLGVGLTLCEVVARYNYRLDPKVYLIDRLPIEVSYSEVIIVGTITMVIAAVATLFPCAKASSLTPVEGLRYD